MAAREEAKRPTWLRKLLPISGRRTGERKRCGNENIFSCFAETFIYVVIRERVSVICIRPKMNIDFPPTAPLTNRTQNMHAISLRKRKEKPYQIFFPRFDSFRLLWLEMHRRTFWGLYIFPIFPISPGKLSVNLHICRQFRLVNMSSAGSPLRSTQKGRLFSAWSKHIRGKGTPFTPQSQSPRKFLFLPRVRLICSVIRSPAARSLPDRRPARRGGRSGRGGHSRGRSERSNILFAANRTNFSR